MGWSRLTASRRLVVGVTSNLLLILAGYGFFSAANVDLSTVSGSWWAWCLLILVLGIMNFAMLSGGAAPQVAPTPDPGGRVDAPNVRMTSQTATAEAPASDAWVDPLASAQGAPVPEAREASPSGNEQVHPEEGSGPDHPGLRRLTYSVFMGLTVIGCDAIGKQSGVAGYYAMIALGVPMMLLLMYWRLRNIGCSPLWMFFAVYSFGPLLVPHLERAAHIHGFDSVQIWFWLLLPSPFVAFVLGTYLSMVPPGYRLSRRLDSWSYGLGAFILALLFISVVVLPD